MRLWPFKKRERWWLVGITEKDGVRIAERLIGIFPSEQAAKDYRVKFENNNAHTAFVLGLNSLVGAGFWFEIEQVR